MVQLSLGSGNFFCLLSPKERIASFSFQPSSASLSLLYSLNVGTFVGAPFLNLFVAVNSGGILFCGDLTNRQPGCYISELTPISVWLLCDWCLIALLF